MNFGHQAVHRTAVTAKALTTGVLPTGHHAQLLYRLFAWRWSGDDGGAALSRGFRGYCSRCAPAYNWTEGLGAGTTQINQAMFPDPNNLEKAVSRARDSRN